MALRKIMVALAVALVLFGSCYCPCGAEAAVAAPVADSHACCEADPAEPDTSPGPARHNDRCPHCSPSLVVSPGRGIDVGFTPSHARPIDLFVGQASPPRSLSASIHTFAIAPGTPGPLTTLLRLHCALTL